MKKGFDPIEIEEQLEIAAALYPMKAMAYELGKAYSTLKGEFNNDINPNPDRTNNPKLGFQTFLHILERVHRLDAPIESQAAARKALDKIEDIAGRVSYVVPNLKKGNMVPFMQQIAEISKDYGKDIMMLATAIEDGVITEKEASDCRATNKLLITACIKLQAYLEQFILP